MDRGTGQSFPTRCHPINCLKYLGHETDSTWRWAKANSADEFHGNVCGVSGKLVTNRAFVVVVESDSTKPALGFLALMDRQIRKI